MFAALDAEQFQTCFVSWVTALTGIPAEVIAIDGKTSRRSGKKGGVDPIHMVSAFAARQRLVLGQVKVEQKSNEIVAIPKLLEMLAIEGAIVTIDAMGCQREIARKIVDKKADYVLALKGNQGTLREDVELFAKEQKAKDFKDTTVSKAKTVDGEHGRIETRRTTVFHDIAWLQERHDWPGLKAVVMVESEREIGARVLKFPPLWALLVGFTVMPAQPPGWIANGLQLLSASLLPLAMLAIGLSVRLSLPRGDLKPLAIGLGLKLAVLPALSVALVPLLGLSGAPARATVLESAMPPMVTAGALAISHGLAPRLAAAMVGYGLLLSLLTLPLWASLPVG